MLIVFVFFQAEDGIRDAQESRGLEDVYKRQAQHRGVDAYIATGRLKHADRPPPAPRGPIPKDATPKQRMARKLRTKTGKTRYARRKAIIEPVFGQIDTVQGGKHVLLRGLAAAQSEWTFLAAGHNIRKLHNHTRSCLLYTSPSPRDS